MDREQRGSGYSGCLRCRNHEYYGASVLAGIRDAREAAAGYPNLHFLENDVITIHGVGSLAVAFGPTSACSAVTRLSMVHAEDDFKKIEYTKLPYRRFKAIHAYRMHKETRTFLKSALDERSEAKTVVVTHHAPTLRSLHPYFRSDPLASCYASDLEPLIMDRQPDLWVHGHVHNRTDCSVGRRE